MSPKDKNVLLRILAPKLADYTKAELRQLENPPEGWTECGCCSCWHPADYTGDCRDDSKRWPS